MKLTELIDSLNEDVINEMSKPGTCEIYIKGNKLYVTKQDGEQKLYNTLGEFINEYLSSGYSFYVMYDKNNKTALKDSGEILKIMEPLSKYADKQKDIYLDILNKSIIIYRFQDNA
jgi:hypothetical protein